MTQKGFYFDQNLCTGCRTCSVACSDLRDLPPGLLLRRVLEHAGGSWRRHPDGSWSQDVFAYYTSLGCNECAAPACVAVCPTKAHHKRSEDGLVIIDTDRCVGCGACALACPYEVPKLDPAARKMRKCDGCLERTSRGGQPVCVESCPQRALRFGDIEELRREPGTGDAFAPLPPSSLTHPSLVIKPCRSAKPSA